MKVHGNLTGLKPSQRDRLEKLYDRKVPKERIISGPLAQSIAELSFETGRQVGLTLDRAGRVVHWCFPCSRPVFERTGYM